MPYVSLCDSAITRWHTKETHHGRSEKIHLAKDCEDMLLRNLRVLILFLRVPGKCLSLRADKLSMWLPQTNFRSVGRLPRPPVSVGGVKAEVHRSCDV